MVSHQDRTDQAPKSRDSDATRKLLMQAVGELLVEKGFTGLGVNAVARQAGVDKVLIYRYFGGLPGLMEAFGQGEDFWPSIEELAGGDIDAYGRLELDEKMVVLGQNFMEGLRKRPVTLEVMAWEMVQRNALTEILENIRERRMLKFAEMFLADGSARVDLMAITTILGAGIMYLLCRARSIQWYNGIDLRSDAGWQRIEEGSRQVIEGLMRII